MPVNTDRNTARRVGVLLLAAMVASLVGGGLVESAISAPNYLAAVAANKTQLIVGSLLELVNAIAVVGLLIPIFFCLGALLLYSATYRARLLPRFISIWGLVGVVLALVLNLVLLFLELDMAAAMILALPIILNEVFLGIWLIVVGFNPRSA
jgi:hypothetical protein